MSAAEEGFRRLNWPHRGVRLGLSECSEESCLQLQNDTQRLFARVWDSYELVAEQPSVYPQH